MFSSHNSHYRNYYADLNYFKYLHRYNDELLFQRTKVEFSLRNVTSATQTIPLFRLSYYSVHRYSLISFKVQFQADLSALDNVK